MNKVDFIVKSKVSEENFEDIVEEWLSDGDYTPDDIIENIISEKNAKLLPIHHYKARYSGQVSASLGYSRTEYYTVYNPETKKQERKSRTVIDWIPHSQAVSGDVTACEYAGEPTFQNLADFIDGTGWSSQDLIVPDNNASIDPRLANLFTSDHKATWNSNASLRCHKKACAKSRADLPSTLVRNFTPNINYDVYHIKSLLLPFWIYSYDYQRKKYYVVVDGNNPERIFGERPVNKYRKFTVIGLRWIGWVGGIFSSYKVANAFVQGPIYTSTEYRDLKTIALFLIGFIITWIIVEGTVKIIKQSSKNRRAAKLKKKRTITGTTPTKLG